jgi:hypothetical protein
MHCCVNLQSAAANTMTFAVKSWDPTKYLPVYKAFKRMYEFRSDLCTQVAENGAISNILPPSMLHFF